MAQLSGKVTFEGQPVPAGWISFTPDATAREGYGGVKVLQIKDGVYDSSQASEPLLPGPYQLRIAGFDGIQIPLYGQGKQIFNPVDETFAVPEGKTTKDFIIPDSAGRNVKIQPTADT